MDQLMDHEQEWARDLFDRAREGDGAETAWTADAVAIGRAGDRKRRARGLGIGGGALTAVAVTVVATVGISGGPVSKDAGRVGKVGATPTSAPVAGAGWGQRPLSQVFDYVRSAGFSVKTDKHEFIDVLPQSAAKDTATILGLLDPSLAHVRAASQSNARGAIVPDSDPKAGELSELTLDGIWTTDGATPKSNVAVLGKAFGAVSISYASNSNTLGVMSSAKTDVSYENLPCGYMTRDVFLSQPGHTTNWSECAVKKLPDGSKIDVASTANGAGTVVFAVRQFPGDQGGVSVVVWDYPQYGVSKDGGPSLPGAAPDPSTVVTPSPFSADLLVKALSDPSITFGLTPDAKPDAPAGFLTPDDLGTGWSLDPSMSHGGTTELQMDNGCAPDKSMFNLSEGKAAQFSGKLPDNVAASVFEGEYKLPKGTGAATMQLARKQAEGGCDPAPGVRFSLNTATDLPSGIGDGGFVQYDHGDSSVRIAIRFGDTIVEAFVTQPGGTSVPDVSSPADQAWLAHVAQQIAARWTGK